MDDQTYYEYIDERYAYMHRCTQAHTHLFDLDAGGNLAAHTDGTATANGGGFDRAGDGGGEGGGATKNKHDLMIDDDGA